MTTAIPRSASRPAIDRCNDIPPVVRIRPYEGPIGCDAICCKAGLAQLQISAPVNSLWEKREHDDAIVRFGFGGQARAVIWERMVWATMERQGYDVEHCDNKSKNLQESINEMLILKYFRNPNYGEAGFLKLKHKEGFGGITLRNELFRVHAARH
jgi:hypothetical protein